MLNQWIERLAKGLEDDNAGHDTVPDLERVSAQLLMEVARADHTVAAEERRTIRDALCRAFSLSPAEIDEIVARAESEADNTVSLHRYVQTVNDRFDKPAKIRLLEQMWRVALADGDLDKYEEYTVRKLADLLHVKHRDFMQAKLRIVDEDPSDT